MSETMTIERANGREVADSVIEQVVIVGDLKQLTSSQRSAYYAQVCRSMGLNPLTRPFDYLTLNGKLTLYARKDATDQLRKINGVSVEIVSRETLGDVYVVTARASMPDGRQDEEIGAVAIAGLKGEALANAWMKASTKAKRRVTLSICGLGWLDESEVESIPDARQVAVDVETGEIKQPEPGVQQPSLVPGAAPPRIEARPAMAMAKPTYDELVRRCELLYARAQGLGIPCEEPTGTYAERSAWGRRVHPLVLAAEEKIPVEQAVF